MEGVRGEVCRVRRATFWEFCQSHLIIVPVCYWESWKPLHSAYLLPSCSEGGEWWRGVWSWDTGMIHRCHMSHCTLTNPQHLPLHWPRNLCPESQPRKLPFPSALVGLAFSLLLSTTFLPFCPVPIIHCPVGI